MPAEVRAVGGVHPAVPAGPPVAGSVIERWSEGWTHRAAYSNAGSALAALLRARDVRRAWLPAYVCPIVASAVSAARAEIAWFAVDGRLEGDLRAAARQARAGEAVIGVDYFGRAPCADLQALQASRPDLLWIEDRAQALDTGTAPWGDAVIYSPRKLLGVGDGGLLLARFALPQPRLAALDLWAPEEARALDPDGHAPEAWRGLFRAREAAMRIGDEAMSGRSLSALGAVAVGPMSRTRRANWKILAERLEAFALWPDADPDFAPLAFPILAPDAAEAARDLAAERIWAPRHWADLPSDPAVFGEAHELSRRMLSLPCDQRYGRADMERVAGAVLRRLQPLYAGKKAASRPAARAS